MEVVITGRHVEVTDEIRDYVEEKVGKLTRFYARIHEAEVILDQESEQFVIEIIMRAGHKHTFVATETGPDPFALVDVTTDKIERQLKKQKEREKDHSNRDAKPELGNEAM